MLKNEESSINGGTTTKYFGIKKVIRQRRFNFGIFVCSCSKVFLYMNKNKKIKDMHIFNNFSNALFMLTIQVLS